MFDDGTMECRYISSSTSTLNGNYITSVWATLVSPPNFPSAFFSTPILTPIVKNISRVSSWAGIAGIGLSNISPGGIYLFSGTQNASASAGYVAIGRWK